MNTRTASCLFVLFFLCFGAIGCATSAHSPLPPSDVFTTIEETEGECWEEDGMIHAEAEGSGTDYDSAERLATMHAASRIGERIGMRVGAVIARPDFRVYGLEVVRANAFFRVKVHAVIPVP